MKSKVLIPAKLLRKCKYIQEFPDKHVRFDKYNNIEFNFPGGVLFFTYLMRTDYQILAITGLMT